MTLVDGQSTLFDHPVLDGFHPVVRTWFAARFPDGPTPPQVQGWPAIAAGQDTLIAAPTGSGKTLSGFLVGIDRLHRDHDRGELATTPGVRVLYVSPLRALAVDIKENLEVPLDELAATAKRLGYEPPDIRVGVRTGDTTAAGRTALLRRPPHLLVTTPESLYLLLTAPRGRQMLATVETVVVDEIHALARDKRGAHLALSLERLEHVTLRRPVRIGLSATQKPIETVARLLVGNRTVEGRPACTIVDTGHQRALDLQLELPGGELEAIASAEQFGDVLERIAALVEAHHTTLVFVNTRSMAERVAHLLGERLGDDRVAAHHGSLSKDRRQRVEARLRAGDLRALVATASLELGIDVGPVDLVCQLGSPRSLATFLQRVGRSGHSRYGMPKGRIFPLTRDELVECAALLIGTRAGRLDAIEPPVAPLDILTQQLVAEAATERWNVDRFYDLARRSAPYADLSRDDFDRVVALASEGVPTGRGRRGDHLHHDRLGGEVAGRRGARLAAATSGGAIPELADYRVVADPDDTVIGTVNEEWAVESMAGDVFLLGTHTWRIRRIEPGVVRVVDADGAQPTVPFWRGEAPGRTRELSEEVSRLRGIVDGYLTAEDPDGARTWLRDECALPEEAAVQIVAYLAAGRMVLGLLPTREELVIERFFDESGGMQLLVHCPYGARINRGFGLALRKRFCVTFDFELQAAASDDALVLSLGPQHSFPLESVPSFLRADTVETVLRQAVLVPPSPLFVARWRWNLNRSLTVLRWKGGRKNPPAIQRMEADDIMATVFPQAAACQENVSGPLEIPDHPLVRQTMHDTLTEAMDIDGLRALLAAIECGQVRVHCRDSVEPSVLAHELLVGKPYTFLDDGEAAERRTRAVPLRRGLPVALEEIGRLAPDAIARVRAEVAPDPRTADELHDLLLLLVSVAPVAAWEPHLEELVARGRAQVVTTGGQRRWCATESLPLLAALAPEATLLGGRLLRVEVEPAEAEDAVVAAVRGQLEITGPVTAEDLAARIGVRASSVAIALAALEAEGWAIQGRFTPAATAQQDAAAVEWCARRLLARIHVYSQKRRRTEIEPVTAQDFMRFLLRWQKVAPDDRVHGETGVTAVIEQLQGWELPAGSWEAHVLPARVRNYRPELLDQRGHAGEVTWGRLSLPSIAEDDLEAALRSTRSTPLGLCTRGDLGWLLVAARGGTAATVPTDGPLAAVLRSLASGGARFLVELAADTGFGDHELDAALWDGVARGLLTADSFWAMRSLIDLRRRTARAATSTTVVPRRRLRRGAVSAQRQPGEGRWALLPPPLPIEEPDELAEAVAEQLLARWGVVFRDLFVRERLAIPWRDVQWALRRLEARGVIRGGRFVTGFSGEQYALPDAATVLTAVRRAPRTGEAVDVHASDPLNLTGVVLPGERVPSNVQRTITFVDGLVSAVR